MNSIFDGKGLAPPVFGEDKTTKISVWLADIPKSSQTNVGGEWLDRGTRQFREDSIANKRVCRNASPARVLPSSLLIDERRGRAHPDRSANSSAAVPATEPPLRKAVSILPVRQRSAVSVFSEKTAHPSAIHRRIRVRPAAPGPASVLSARTAPPEPATMAGSTKMYPHKRQRPIDNRIAESKRRAAENPLATTTMSSK